MDIFGAIGDSFKIMKKRPLPVLLILIFEIALVLPVTFFFAKALPMGAARENPSMTPQAALSLLFHSLSIIGVVAIVAILIMPLFIGYFVAIANQYYNKKPLSTPLAFTAARKRYMSILGASALLSVIGGVLVIIPIVLIVLSFTTSLVLLPVGFLLLIIVLLLWEIWTFETYQIIIGENRNAIPAFKRSVQIGNRNWASIVGLLIVVGIGYVILSFVFGLFADVFGTGSFFLVATILRAIPGGLFACFSFILPVAFYKQLKLKKS